MRLHGKHIIGGTLSQEGAEKFQAINPRTGQPLEPYFADATESEVDRALRAADEAFQEYRKCPPERKSALLERMADGILGLGDELIRRCSAETGLQESRLVAERTRTVNQILMFAALVRDGSWVDARIDTAIPDRKPTPRLDLRRMLIPIGPVAVFGASNFPLAFSVAGGDTASALAAGNPVVVKAHPSHPGTSELVAGALRGAIEEVGMPDGLLSLLHGVGTAVGISLVRHPLTKAVGFTGSRRGGRALFEAACGRPEPIPVYAEMGSINPVFVLPGALGERGDRIAEELKQSVTLGVGQFCTNPGLIVGLQSEEFDRFIKRIGELIRRTSPETMLSARIRVAYESGVQRFANTPGVRVEAQTESAPDTSKNEVKAFVFATDFESFRKHRELSEEVFGPSTLIVRCNSRAELETIARELDGHLTATVHCTDEDLKEHSRFIPILEQKVGRLILNGYPTGVEVCPSMHHGGPYPATTDIRSTSVGTAAIMRFARPICYQNFPDEMLPPELQNANPMNIWRLVNGELTKARL
ncbi:MAG: aldehyde dehydrogenase (NADP(+)) [bacterium]